MAWGHSAAQPIPTGAWRAHPSFRDTRLLEAAGDFIYAASVKGFYKVKIQTGELAVLGKLQGFHGTEITALRYNEAKNTLFIGYSDGYIDLLKNSGDIIPLPGFYNKLLQGDKSILHVCFEGNLAYVSTRFGILSVNLDLEEISDSYTSIGPGGTTQAVLSCTVARDSLFAGLPDGMIAARLSSTVNLNDFNNWRRVISGTSCRHLSAFQDSVFFSKDSQVQMYYSGKTVQRFSAANRNIVRIDNLQDRLCVFRPGGILTMTAQGSLSTAAVNIIAHGTVDKNLNNWYCTGIGGGAIRLIPGGELGYLPNGPNSNSVFAMTQHGETMVCTGGGVNSTFGNAYNDAGYYIFTPTGWGTSPASPLVTNMYDFTFTHYNPVSGKIYIATHTNGLLELNGTVVTNKWDENNAPLERLPVVNFIRVSGLASDAKGNLWVANYGAANALHRMARNGTWTSWTLPVNTVRNLVVDKYGYKWMINTAGGVLVFDDNNTATTADDRSSLITTQRGGLITNDVLSLATDENGYVWIGTSQGLNVITNPMDAFTNPRADRFVIDQGGSVGYLLGEETINDICVDGGNRKWFATNNGLFLAEPNGQKVLLHFREKDSPLPSDRVYCIGQNGKTGELFFGTENGIVSYRSDASDADSSFGNIRVFPNPVKPGYTGNITIDGLATDAEIRITDANGILVYQTRANGGTATWNGLRLDGSRPSSGVYYVFGVNGDGTETAMARFIFIR
ncbi:MAG: T9SS type A sorting domain-containing protein [Bacteroidetes bacterium]|nr:T9SS type A sorting domain-containing protein [Bacteroidota bacterium]